MFLKFETCSIIMGNFKCDKELLQKLLAEFTATAMMMTLGCTSSSMNSVGVEEILGFNVLSSSYPIGWGLSYMAAIHTFAFISGAHINPWVTISAAIFQVIEIPMMICYILVQLLGSLVGAGMAIAVSQNNNNVCMVKSVVPTGNLIALEFLATALLLFAYCAIWDKRSEGAYDSLSLRVGFLISGLCYAIVSNNYIMYVYA